MLPIVLLSTSPNSGPADDLRDLLMASGFAVQPHTMGSPAGVDFAPIQVGLIDVGGKVEAAVAQTRRWRAELGEEVVPIVWASSRVDPELAVAGFDAGADSVIARPLNPAVFEAQMRSAVRCRTAAARVSARAAESRILGEHLTRALAQFDRELEASRRIRFAFLPQSLPAVGAVRFAVCHRPRARTGGDFYSVHAVDPGRVVFHIGDVVGSGAGGGLLGRLVAEMVSAAAREANTPGELLASVNRELLRLGLEDQPLVALLVGILNAHTGEVAIARAGLPAPVLIPAKGEPATWAVPGPFLGTAETTYCVHKATLFPGDKLLIGTDGTRADGDPSPTEDTRFLERGAAHRTQTGQAFVDAVARDLLADVRHNDDFTLFCLEFDGKHHKRG
jgi:phosphoserine phosphatase RsbU/P